MMSARLYLLSWTLAYRRNVQFKAAVRAAQGGISLFTVHRPQMRITVRVNSADCHTGFVIVVQMNGIAKKTGFSAWK